MSTHKIDRKSDESDNLKASEVMRVAFKPWNLIQLYPLYRLFQRIEMLLTPLQIEVTTAMLTCFLGLTACFGRGHDHRQAIIIIASKNQVKEKVGTAREGVRLGLTHNNSIS